MTRTPGIRHTFRRAQRLARPEEYSRALRTRPTAVSAHFQIFRHQAEAGPRLGIVVGKRYVPRSVDRNRIKRMIREAFRGNLERVPRLDSILRVRNVVTKFNATALRAEINGLLGVGE